VWSEISEVVHVVGNAIEVMAVLVIAYASLETFVAVVRLAMTRASLKEGRGQWVRFLNLLVVGLTFQLAADLVHITIARGWEPLGRAVVIAVLRTFLSYFLGRDLREAKEAGEPHASAA
jgi:uncharacterized membrane protein